MKRFSAILLPLLLAACMGAEEAPPAPAIPPAPAEETPPVVVESVPEPEPAPAPIVVDFARIDGQTPADVLAYIGAPTLVRRDENVQVMIFENSVCVFEVVFYEPNDGDYFRARHYGARNKSGQNVDTEACARSLLEAQQARP